METDTVIKVDHLYKKFCLSLKRSLAYGTLDLARNFIGIPTDQGKLRPAEFWALDDIDFELKKGEALGIIGLNGSGKSTLLRVLTGIFPPDKGKVTVKGTIGSLIAVGAGFHPHMTGRENIYLNATILGMNKKDIDKKFQDIIDFADIGKFIDAPVSTYSSGMRVRLGFAIAINSDPDILLIDEILSVGDLSFRNKSLRYMADLRKKANAIIFVSHNLDQIRTLCDKVIVLDKGKMIFYGNTQEGIVHYEEKSREERTSNLREKELFKSRMSSSETEVVNIGILNSAGELTTAVNLGEPFSLVYDIVLHREVEELFFSAGVLDEEYRPVIWVMSNDENENKKEFKNLKKGKYKLKIDITENHLMPRVYVPNLAIRNGATSETYERILPNFSFTVKSNNNRMERGIILVNEKWELKKYE